MLEVGGIRPEALEGKHSTLHYYFEKYIRKVLSVRDVHMFNYIGIGGKLY